MSIVSLGTIKHAPKIVFDGEVSVIWPDSSLRFSEGGELHLPVELNPNKTYVIALRSIKGTVTVDGESVEVAVTNISCDNYEVNKRLFGGGKFTDSIDFAYAVFVPTPVNNKYNIRVGKSSDAGKASLFLVRVIEL